MLVGELCMPTSTNNALIISFLTFFALPKPTHAHNKPAVPIFIQKSRSVLDRLLSAFECFHGSQVIPCAKYMLVLVLAVAE